jgi:hypothetical protein
VSLYERPGRRWEYDIKIDIKGLSESRLDSLDSWQGTEAGLLKTVMNRLVPKKLS